MINSINKDENAENGEDPALKSITSVFKSLFSSSSDTTTAMPGASALNPNPMQNLLPPELLSLFQNFSPVVIPGNNMDNMTQEQKDMLASLNLNQVNQKKEPETGFSPNRLLQMLTPHINENLVKEIQTVYEFHIKMKKDAKAEDCQVFFLDLKNVPKGQAGPGRSMFSKADCTIKLSEEDLIELLSDNLKPFTAYMSGRIEIDGDLQDVFKLKKLIKAVTAVPKK